MKTKQDQSVPTSNNRSLLYLILIIVVVGVGVFIAMQLTGKKKIVFIRINESIEKFEGMKEARSLFDQKKIVWKTSTDTLEARYRNSQQEYNTSFAKLSADERKTYQMSLQRQYDDMLRYQQAIEEQAKKEENELITGVVTQINSYAEEMAKRHAYDIILGASTTTGNVMYGVKEMDITDEFIAEMNNAYLSNHSRPVQKPPVKKDK